MHVEVRTDWQPSDTHRKAAAKVWKPRTVKRSSETMTISYYFHSNTLEELGSKSGFLYVLSQGFMKSLSSTMTALQCEALGLPTLFKGVLEMPRTQSQLKLRHLPDRTCHKMKLKNVQLEPVGS